MRKDSFFSALAILLGVITAIQIGDVYFEIYRYIGWLDTATHFLGGAWTGGMALWFLRRTDGLLSRAMFAILVAFGAALVVGLGWELYEFGVVKVFGLAFPTDYVRDTITDLVADSAGGIGAAACVFLRYRKKEKPAVF